MIENERDRLKKENEELMVILKQVQDGLVVNDEVLGKSNSLFVVNGKSNIVKSLPVQRAPASSAFLEVSSSVAGPRAERA